MSMNPSFDIITDIRYNLFMILNEIMYSKNWSKYKLSKESKIPYSTIEDIFSMKTNIENLTLNNSIKLANALGVDLSYIINLQNKTDEDLFRSQVCHDLKNNGDLKFIEKTIESNEIIKLYKYHLYFESLYLLSMLDYVSKKNNIPLVEDYSYIRKQKLKEISYPKSLLYFSSDNKYLLKEFNNSIPEFKQHNIAEKEVYNVV